MSSAERIGFSSLVKARVRARLTDVLRWSAGDEHRHVRVVGRDKCLVRLSERISHGVTQCIEGRFHESHCGVSDGAAQARSETPLASP